MKLVFAEKLPFSTGCAKTPEEREKAIADRIPSSFSPCVDGPRKNTALIIMRRRLSGYEWRMYEIPNLDWLVRVSSMEENTVANREGYDLTVMTMVTRRFFGNDYSYPGERPYHNLSLRIRLGIKRTWRSWMEKQAARALVN